MDQVIGKSIYYLKKKTNKNYKKNKQIQKINNRGFNFIRLGKFTTDYLEN